MTIDKLRADLLLVAAIGNSIASVLGALGDSVSELELAPLLSKVPEARLHLENCEKDTKDISNVSENDAESIIVIIKDILQHVANSKEVLVPKKAAFAQLAHTFSMDGLFVPKKAAFAQLPDTFSTDGLLVPSNAEGTVIHLLHAQIEGVHALVMSLSNAIILIMPSNHTEEVKRMKDELDSHFQETITAYSL